jgi:phospholipid/cholesterol/gamma-HCH transport system permease protein
LYPNYQLQRAIPTVSSTEIRALSVGGILTSRLDGELTETGERAGPSDIVLTEPRDGVATAVSTLEHPIAQHHKARSTRSAGVVAAVVSRIGQIPVRSAGTVGRSVLLAGAVLRYAVTDTVSLRLPFGELIVQAWTLLKVTALPAILMAIPFGAMVAVQISGLVNEVGANSLVGSVTGVAVLRQGAPVTAGLLMGGAAAAAIASDFGARAIREELDALRTLGIDPVRRLVVPRFLALQLITPILVVIVIAMGVGAAFVIATMVNGVTPGSFWLSFGSFAKMVDLWFTLAKGFFFAAIVAVISSQRGMEAKGGPRGVADAVNASVVLNVIFIIVVNLAITQFQTMFFPMAVA